MILVSKNRAGDIYLFRTLRLISTLIIIRKEIEIKSLALVIKVML